MYHMVRDSGENDSRFCCSPDEFRKQMAYLKKAGYRVVGLSDLAGNGSVKADHRNVALTFDDGFLDNYENAHPILAEFGYPWTIFVVGGQVGKDNDWMTTRGFPARRMLGWEGLRELAGSGVDIGSHTLSHPDLSTLDGERLRIELNDSRSLLEQNLGRPVVNFAYPYGRLTDETGKAVEAAGYKAACTTRSGFNRENESPFLLRRIEVYGSDTISDFSTKLKFGSNDSGLKFVSKYYLSRFKEKTKGLIQWT